MERFWAVNSLRYMEQIDLSSFWRFHAMYDRGAEEEKIGGAIAFKKTLDEEFNFLLDNLNRTEKMAL